ncbi:MAG: hypothetical protein V4621_02670 [Pseudomonadota bacterium]
MNILTLIFDVGEKSGGEEPKNHVKKLLAQNSCRSVQDILLGQELTTEQKEDVHTFWTECGHKVREKVKNDLQLELLLKRTLPAYTGSKITLYRGENIERYKNQKIGFCWTENQKTARMFARGLNSQPTGGVLLECCFEKEQIFAAPSPHSVYLGEYEYTVAPSTINFNQITILESFPPNF